MARLHDGSYARWCQWQGGAQGGEIHPGCAKLPVPDEHTRGLFRNATQRNATRHDSTDAAGSWNGSAARRSLARSLSLTLSRSLTHAGSVPVHARRLSLSPSDASPWLVDAKGGRGASGKVGGIESTCPAVLPDVRRTSITPTERARDFEGEFGTAAVSVCGRGVRVH